MQGYWDSSIRVHLNAEILSTQELASVFKEPSFIHISDRAETSESRWQYLYKTEPRITDSNSLLVSDYITRNIGRLFETRYLTEQIEALKRLNVPTARLERLFAEHIDCCTYRLDAWWLGLVRYQLELMRSQRNAIEGEEGSAKGIYLGAYGWLEDVRSENKVLTPVQLEPELNEIFNKTATTPLLKDSSNEGYIHAPSLNHAVTAAVLRNGYLSNNTTPNLDPTKQPLAVNLSSERVRLALSVLEGIRNGQSLGALLGYQLERGLHDRYTVAELDQFILKLRKAFPLRAKRLKNQTPRSGITLTHRIGLHLQSGLPSNPTATPRMQAEPALNKWLANVLPPANNVGCKVTYRNPVNNAEVEHIVTQQDLEIPPIDLLYLLRTDSEQAMTELDDRILLHVIQTFSPRPDVQLKIKYTERLSSKISFFELAPMVHSLRSLVLRSRPLKASDIALHNQATKAQEEKVFVDRQRLDVPLNSLTNLKTDVEVFKTTLENLLENLDTLLQDADANSVQIVATRTQIAAVRTQIIASVDDRITTAIDLLSKASRFGIPQTGWGFALERKQSTFSKLLDKVSELVNRWQERLDQFNVLFTEYNTLPGSNRSFPPPKKSAKFRT